MILYSEISFSRTSKVPMVDLVLLYTKLNKTQFQAGTRLIYNYVRVIKVILLFGGGGGGRNYFIFG